MGWWIVLWSLSGVLGWGWTNYCAYNHDGPEADASPAKWHVLIMAPLAGPTVIFVNLMTCISNKAFYWGLRFK